MKIGKARFGNAQKKYFKLKDGEQAYRILPPLGKLADQGRWSVFHSVHYGYKTSDGRQKPFLSPEVKNRKTGMIEVRDAAKERIQMLKGKLEEAKKTGNKAMFDELNVLAGSTALYNLDNNHYMNVIDANGTIGVLKLRHKAKLALDVEIKKLDARKIDPTSVENGRFFVFTRTGLGRDTTFSVSVLQEELNVAGVGNVKREVTHTLNEETLNRLKTEASELNDIYKKPTSEEVSKIVESSTLKTGVSTYLDELYKKNATENTVTEEDVDNYSDDTVETTSNDSTQTSGTTAPLTPYSSAALLNGSQSNFSTPKSITEMSNDDFLAALNKGTL